MSVDVKMLPYAPQSLLLLPHIEFDFIIFHFEYNGFSGKLLDGETSFRGRFLEWTNDPGIMRMDCSDGRRRLIPSFAVRHKSGKNHLPKQVYKKSGLTYFGPPSTSR